MVLTAASTAVFFEALDIAILNLAVPLIQKDLHLEYGVVQWLQTIYVLLYGGFLMIGGKLSDTLGRKKIFLGGSGLFMLTSLGAGLSGSFGLLLFFRALQGLAAALVMPSSMSIITNTFTERRERDKAIGIYSSFAAVGSGCGLSLGGIIATLAGWQWIFFINVPVIAVVLLLGAKYIGKDTRKAEKRAPDLLSAILLVLTILMLSYAVHELGALKENFPLILAFGLSIAAGGLVFRRRMKKQDPPYIDFGLFRHKITAAGNMVTLLLGGFFTGYLFLISLFLQQNLGFSAAGAGMLLLPFSILSALVSKFLLPVLFKKMHVLQTGILGMGLMLTGALALLYTIVYGYSIWLTLLSAACVTGSGMALSFSSLTSMAVQKISREQQGLASGVVSTAYFVGAGLGMSLLSLFMPLGARAGAIGKSPVILIAFYAFCGVAWLVKVSRELRE